MEFRVLGPLEVRRDGVCLPVRAPRQRALLAALLLRANEVVSAERLVEVVWGPVSPPSAAANLRSHLTALRRLFGPEQSRLIARSGGYLLTVYPGELDLAGFTAAAERGREALRRGQTVEAARQLRDALARCRGQPLENVELHGVEAELARLGEARLAVTEDCLRARLAAGQEGEVVAELRELTAAHPSREQPPALLMLALHRCGRPAEALTVYEHTRRRLAEELGVDPGPELRRLHQLILSEDSSPEPARPTPPAQLPQSIIDFTGRGNELRELDELLDRRADGTLVAAITGGHGLGKTALAVRWAHRHRPRFPDGQLHADLCGHTSGLPAHTVLARFLRALGAATVPPSLAEAAALYRSLLADRRVLVLLDNAIGPEQVRPLLPGSPGSLVLITSRDPLDGLVVFESARRLRLNPLPPEESHTLLATLLGPDRLHAEPEAATQLAKLCDHLPLALRIAAAGLSAHPERALAEHLDRLRAAVGSR
ncbi:AfsR/SARP family transcriptional regulator [Crossiella cryophila]|uniref:DNA-binding SARP family transcriptional activator n=1 Tax=Crossiella cryophila TaxID=43355 RepID=A0A7W7CHE5_9PSEU|nr:AfsR/SARP family transcriptional regulator [Crossiella cryophila]MBB4679816.1 DNA-binding SARP family transcriptional activator [Crossiella cryophila]